MIQNMVEEDRKLFDEASIRNRFIFLNPANFFDRHVSEPPSEIEDAVKNFLSNLTSTVELGMLPFSMSQVATLQQKYQSSNDAHLAMLAQQTRSRDYYADDRVSMKESVERSFMEMLQGRIFRRNVLKQTIANLEVHLSNAEFARSIDELLRQLIVMSWNAIEILFTDLVLEIVNKQPNLFENIRKNSKLSSFLSDKALLSSLSENKYDGINKMGSILCELIKFDSIERIKCAADSLNFCGKTQNILKSTEMHTLFQQRNLIVHRRGVVDIDFKRRNNTKFEIGQKIIIDSKEAENVLNLARNAGFAMVASATVILTGQAPS